MRERVTQLVQPFVLENYETFFVMGTISGSMNNGGARRTLFNLPDMIFNLGSLSSRLML
jgi:hypothetical protein